MKNLLLCFPLIALLAGCAIFSPDATPEQKAADVQRIAYAASSIGVEATLQAKPEFRPAFELAYTNLNILVEAKTISGAQLREILHTLPVVELGGPSATLYIESGTLLFDVITGKPIDLEKTPYVLAAATGIRDGMKVALKK